MDNNKQLELEKEIVSLHKSIKDLINLVHESSTYTMEYMEKMGTNLTKTADIVKDLADEAGGTMKVDSQDIQVSNKVNGGLSKDILRKIEKLNNKYNES